MNLRNVFLITAYWCLLPIGMLAEQPKCPKGYQPFADRCVSQRMSDYITCVTESGANKESISLEISNAQAGKTAAGAKGSGSGVVAKGSGSLTIDNETEKALATKFEEKWGTHAMEECRKALDPPRSPQPKKPQSSSTQPSDTKQANATQFNASQGIAIGGNATVTNPTVNNYTALPDLRMSDMQENQVSESLGQSFTGVDVSIMMVQANQNTRDFSSRLARIFKSSGATVELSDSQMYAPGAGMTLHKGMAIESFPPEHKDAVEKFANALGAAKVIQIMPIYERGDKKINIVINRSADTPDEAKQY